VLRLEPKLQKPAKFAQILEICPQILENSILNPDIFHSNLVLRLESKLQKPTKFAQILEIINNTFKPTFVQKFSRIRVCNALAVPVLFNL
jgi:hypothetical protein